MSRVGFGIAGCGVVSAFHAKALEKVEDACLVGVFDPHKESAEKAAAKYGVRRFETLEDMLACSEIDAVCICTPSGLHASVALHALEAKKHVVMEKPMALTLKDADAVICAAQEANRLVCVISQSRFFPAVQAVKKALDDGMLGKIVHVYLTMKYWREQSYYASADWRGTWAMDGGCLMNQGIHGIDLMQYLAGPVHRLTAICKTQTRDMEAEDSAAAVLEFANGAVGTVDASTTCYPGYPRRLEICGDKGSVMLEEGAILRWDLPVPRPPIDDQARSGASDPTAIGTAGHELQLSNMVRAIQGKEKLLMDACEGRKPVALILSMYESSREGKSMLLD